MSGKLDEPKIEKIAVRFFEQHHDVHNVKVIGFENGIWLVEGEISSSSGKRIRKLKIDDKTGMIIDVE